MSLSPNEKYPGATEADPNYKDSKFKDNNPSTTNNGSPLKALDRNEQLALQEAMMNAAGFDYNGVVDTPQNSQMFNAYKAALSNGANLLSNHNFIIASPDDSQPAPSATPTSYPPGYEIFSGVFANETTGILNLTYIDGRVSFSGGDFYMAVPNTGALENITEFVASVADFDGKPRTRGVSYALVGDEYRVTVGVDALEDESANETPLGSVKFEQGSVATGHEVGSLAAGDLSEYTTVFVDATGEGGAVDDTSAIQDAIDKASALEYVKRGVKIVLRAPKNYYQVSESLNFNELWNVVFECEVANSWNRSEAGDIETTGGNIHWIGNSTDSMFSFGQFCFGVQFRNIIVNGRDTLKLAYDLTAPTPSVLRDFYFENWGAINCDFGAVFGDITGTDLAPVMSINPRFNKCKSAAIVLNSGNLQFTSKGGFITNNGFAPTTGNSFIPDVDNQGHQILQTAGHSWIEKVTLDGFGAGLPASGENVKCAGGTMSVSGWDDTPSVVSVNITGTTQAFEFGHWTHYDGDMLPSNTPVSIMHNAPCCVDMGSGLNIFGDVVMDSAANSGISTSGVNFLDPNSGFSGTGLRGLAGVVKNKSTDDTVIVVGGDQKFIGSDPAPVKRSVISRQNRPADYYESETGSVATTFTVKDNGQYEWLTNVWFDTSTSEYKSVSAGSWSRKLITPNGVEQLNSGSASAANEILTTSIAAGFRQGSGSNGKWQLELSSNKFSFDVPVTGSVVRGDTFMRSSATPGGKAGDIATTTGTMGIDAVLKQFGTIDS